MRNAKNRAKSTYHAEPDVCMEPVGGDGDADGVESMACTAPAWRAKAVCEVALLLGVPAALLVCAWWAPEVSAGTTLGVCVACVVLMFLSFEYARPQLRHVVPTVVLASLAAAGRVLFALVPDVKPVSAIAMIAGASLGKREGFVVGALAALFSNMFFGQGPWTAWQMYAWGCVGYGAGVLAELGLMDRTWVRMVYGFVSALGFGLIMNAYYIVGYVNPITFASVGAALLASIALDVVHGVSTVVFLGILYEPWKHKLARFVRAYGLDG